MAARTPEEIIRATMGDLIFQITILRAENERLKEMIAAIQAAGQAASAKES